MHNGLLAFLIFRDIASGDCEEHRRSRGEIERYIVAKRPAGSQWHNESHPSLLYVAVSDFRALNIAILTLQIRPQPTVLDNRSKVLRRCDVVDICQF
jgi:hypothetical protein